MTFKPPKFYLCALLVAVFFFSCGDKGCGSCDPISGVQESGVKSYKGKPGATAVHTDDKPKLDIVGEGCDPNTKSATYWMWATVGLHNPTDKERFADVHCKYYLGDWEAGTNKTLNVNVPGRGGCKDPKGCSKFVVLPQNTEAQCGQQDAIGITCDVYWKPDRPKL